MASILSPEGSSHYVTNAKRGLGDVERARIAKSEAHNEAAMRRPFNPCAHMPAPAWCVKAAADYFDDIERTMRTGEDCIIDLPRNRRLRILREGLCARITVLAHRVAPVAGFHAKITADGKCRISHVWDTLAQGRERSLDAEPAPRAAVEMCARDDRSC